MALLTPEQAEYIKAEVVKAARQVMVGRSLVPVTPPIGFGAEVYGYDKLTEMTKGKVDLSWGAGFSEDLPGLVRSTTPVGVIHREFQINRRHIEASNRAGTPLRSVAADAAAYAVARQEEDVVILGWSSDGTTYEIPGLFNASGKNTNTGADIGTPTNILVCLNEAIAALQTDNITGPYTWVLNPTQYTQMFAFVANTPTFYYDVAIRRMAASRGGGAEQPGRVIESSAQTVDTSTMTGYAGDRKVELVLGVDLTTEFEELEKGKNVWGIVYETAGIAAYDAQWICTGAV